MAQLKRAYHNTIPTEMSDSISTYLSCFIDSCKTHLGFLEEELDFTIISGLVEYIGGRKVIKPLESVSELPESLRDIWCVVRFEREHFAVELGYGDMDLRLEAYVYHDPIVRSELLELLAVQGVDCGEIPLQWLRDKTVVESAVKIYADLIHANKRFVFKNDENVIRKIQIQRSKRIRETIKAHHDNTMKSITLMSSRAMQTKDYRRVIELLRPYKRYLSKANLKMLEQAQRSILHESG